MPEGNDSDVSAITLSDDEAAPSAKTARPPPARRPAAAAPAQPAAAAAGGSARVRAAAAAARADELDEDGAGGGGQKKKKKGKGRVAFQLPDEDDGADGGTTGRERDDDVPDWKARLRAAATASYDAGDEQDDGGYGDAEGGDDGVDMPDDDGAVRDDSKPLGWSYFRKRDPGEGPVTWEEVDTGELKFVAESLVRSTTTRVASQADEVMAQIFHTVPGEDDTLVPDPLGRGVIDPFTLTMGKRSKMARQVQPVTGEKGLKATMRTFRTARLGASKASGGAAGGADAAGGSGGASRALDDEARKVLPNQEGFEPEAYLAAFHGDSSRSQLEKGLRSLSRELSERTGQLKLLIRNNFDRFINCKDAIDDIHAKLRKMLVRGAGPSTGPGAQTAAAAAAAAQQAVGTDRVFRSLEQVENNARRTFGPILDRAAKADRIRAVAGLLQRFDTLFAAPARVMELAGRGELDQVVREYKRANMLIRPTATSARVWVSLYAEIEKRVTEVYLAVRQLVAEPPPEQGRPMGEDGPVVLFGIAAAGGGGGQGGSSSGSKRGGGGAGSGAAGGALAVAAVTAAAAAGEESGSEAQGQQRLAQLPDYLVFLAFVRQEKLPAAREEDAMRLYVKKLEAHVNSRIEACDKRHTEQLELLVAAWMKATGASAPAVASSAAAGGSASSAAAGGVAALQASISSLTSKQAPGRGASSTLDAGAAGGAGAARGSGKAAASGNGKGRGEDVVGDGEEEEQDEDGADVASLSDVDEDAEAAEAAFLQWQGSVGLTAASPFATEASAPLPYHIRIEMRRLVQDPGGSNAAAVDMLSAGLIGGGGAGSAIAAAAAAAAAASAAAAVEPLPTSTLAPEPVLTAAQRQWVSYVCAVSAALLWAVPGLWATCHSVKYANAPDLEEEAREGLGRGPSLARRLVEDLCAKYAQRLKRAVQSLSRAGPMQPGLPLLVMDACHLWRSLRAVGVGTRALSTLRSGVSAALGAHVSVLGDHLAELPLALFAVDDFRLDLLAADQQPVTVLPRRLEEEVGVALLHYQWPLQSVAEAAGGMEEVPAESSWRPMQSSVLACFSLLSEALAEYARSLYAEAAGGNGNSGSRSSTAKGLKALDSIGEDTNASLGGLSSTSMGAASASGSPGFRSRVSAGGVGGVSMGGSAAAAADALDAGGFEGSVSGGSGAGSSSDVRVLLVISNSAVIRTRVMPGVVERYRRLLAPSAEASATCQRRLRELTGAMRRSNEALGSSYLARKEEAVKAAVQRYVASETAPLPLSLEAGAGTEGASRRSKAPETGGGEGVLLPYPPGPSAGCVLVLQLLNSIHNEALAYSPSNLRPFMVALAEHLVEHLGKAYSGLASAAASAKTSSSSSGGVSLEQLLQLWADLQFLSVALRPLLSAALANELEEGKVVLASAVALRQRSRRYRPASELAADVFGAGEAEACSARLQELLGMELDAWLRRYALNIRCFTAAAASAGAANGGGASATAATGAGGQNGSSSSSSEQAKPAAAGKVREAASGSIAPSTTSRREARAEVAPSAAAAAGEGSRRDRDMEKERERATAAATGADAGQGVFAQSSLRSDAASRAAAALEAAAAAKARRARRAAADDLL
ncbi:hypothetical protein HYH02_003901 [Chlamydomonas schloesseri]|uniref:Exocyst complex component EXOC2/Sec5 N-terminal domain-containing protein n=1 Tax=Chlamydomonas schloesseri TaxID=2026947 RepID=A0A836B9E3_9CHLO|nr:hypothetical protein HYH02_003901 [Chlamydomonas schloesseri]|eukprot:KAG2451295.1 hypothetical protein HYH02_003901 [Chlamydomonas schloesseri]